MVLNATRQTNILVIMPHNTDERNMELLSRGVQNMQHTFTMAQAVNHWGYPLFQYILFHWICDNVVGNPRSGYGVWTPEPLWTATLLQ